MNSIARLNILKWIDRVAFGSFCALAYFLPISNAFIESLIGVIILCFLIRLVALRPLAQDIRFLASRRFNRIAFLFFICISLSLITSNNRLLSFNALLCKWGEGILLFYLVQIFINKTQLRKIIAVFCISAALLSIDGIYQFITGVDFIRGFPVVKVHNFNAVGGAFRHYNNFSCFLIVMFFMNIHFLWFLKRKWVKTLLTVNSLLIVTALMLTYSRGAWLAFLLTAIISLFIIQDKVIRGTLLVVLGAFFIGVFTHPMIKERFLFLLQDTSGRSVIWKVAWQMFKESPVFGKGLGLFMELLPQYARISLMPQYTHNCYLQILAETGIIGFFSFLWFLFDIVGRAYKKMIQNIEILTLGILLGLSAFMIHIFFDTQLFSLKLATLFWLTIGLLGVALIDNREEKNSRE